MTPLRTKGFSVLEVLLSLTILIFVLGTIVFFLIRGYDVFLGFDSSVQTLRTARRTLESMVNDLRETVESPVSGTAIYATADDSVTFHADVDDDGEIERVRFFLDGTSLKRGVSEPPSFTPETEDLSTIGTDIVNTHIFTYYDSSYTGSGDPLPSVDVSTKYRARYVVMTIDVDSNPLDDTTAFSANSSVQLRNLPFPF